MGPIPPHTLTRYADRLDPELLTSPSEVEDILGLINSALTPQNFEQFLEHVLAAKHARTTELLFSYAEIASNLRTWILVNDPNPQKVEATILVRLLKRFSLYFVFTPLPTEMTRLAREFHRVVQLAPVVMEQLSSMTFEDQLHSDDDEDGDGDLYPLSIAVKEKSQKKRKVVKNVKRKRAPMLDSKVLKELNIYLPTSPEEVQMIVSKLITKLKNSFVFYVDGLLHPDVAADIKAGFSPRERQPTPHAADQHVDKLESEPVSDITMQPSAYPMVQPIRSALYFDTAKGFGEWRILISTRADRDLRETRRKDPTTFKIIVKKIKELSNGHFSSDNQKKLNGPATEIPIYEAKMTRDSRLVYQIDCVPEYESQIEQQVIRVFGIYTHAQMDRRLWESVSRQLERRGPEYKKRCIYRERPRVVGDNVYKPGCFPSLPEEDVSKAYNVADLPPDDLEKLHSLLVLEKFVPFSQALLYSMLADLDVQFPFQVSTREKMIIEYPQSCYVLGRSGTGKTTTMLFKMLWIERTFLLNSDGAKKPRQIFVTQSRVLAGKVEEYFVKLLQSLATVSQTPERLKRLASSTKSLKESPDLVDVDDDVNWRSDLPQRFSELLDKHFPLFTTFDRLCSLLEADLGLSRTLEVPPTTSSSRKGAGSVCQTHSSKRTDNKPGSFVSYDLFLEKYWPHFDQTLVKGLDPALVFGEILGVIMGSEKTTTVTQCFLDRAEYKDLSARTQSTFASKRTTIYDIFQAYLNKKRLRGDYDAADRTHGIIQEVMSKGLVGTKVDYLYVDEVQDNLLVDALLLRSLCHNPNGLFWAGDTAQTISVGSSFRFDDLKAFLYRIEEQRIIKNQQSQVAPELKTFQLAINYRSHAGIVNCAHSVIELIIKFWPYSIDALDPEQGVVDGVKPIYLSGWDRDTMQYEQFLFGESGNPMEFGAQQCILVRDEAAKEKFRNQIGDIGLILTLYESKGLEFNDVLLFNFFEDSSTDLSQWRVVLNALEPSRNGIATAPKFDEIKHAGICNELKFLYVAITRARKNMWIADCSEKGEPMKAIWASRNQIQLCTPGINLPRLAVSSTPEEWREMGRNLFERKRYWQAKHCFERAIMPQEAAVSHAYFLREQAHRLPIGSSRTSQENRERAFLEAANAFRACGGMQLKSSSTYYLRAGECFERSGDDVKAAEAYLSGKEYNKSAQLYRKVGRFDEAVEIIQSKKSQMDRDIVDKIKTVARLYYFNEKRIGDACMLFDSTEDALEYLEDMDLDVAQATLLESMGRHLEAAEIHLTEGRTLEAINILLKAKNNVDTMQLAKAYILQGLWKELSFRVSFKEANPEILQYIELSKSLDLSILTARDSAELEMFGAIVTGNRAQLKLLGQAFCKAGSHSYAAACLCLDHYFVNLPSLTTMSVFELEDTLDLFYMYTTALHTVTFHLDPSSPTAERLLGFRRQPDKNYLIPAGTFLYKFINPGGKIEEDRLVSSLELQQVFKAAMKSHLLKRVREENNLCRKSRALSPCVTFSMGSCNRVDCRQEHTPHEDLNAQVYNARVRVHIKQIACFHTLHSILTSAEFDSERRYWISQLYRAINPSFHIFGSVVLLKLTEIDQTKLVAVKQWIYELSYRLTYQAMFLTNLVQYARLWFLFDPNYAANYLYRAPFFFSARPVKYLRHPNKEFMPIELLQFIQGFYPWCLSAGLICIAHIAKEELPISAEALCDLVEHLCASIVVSNRYQSSGDLHDITLPRTCLQLQMRNLDSAAPKATRHYRLLLEPIKTFLEAIYTNKAYMLYEPRTNAMRNILITRLCTAMSLLGYNIIDYDTIRLRLQMINVMTSLQKPERKFSPLYGRYVYARTWNDVVKALRSTFRDSQMDNMVQLLSQKRLDRPRPPIRNVQQLVYKGIDEVLHLLGDPPSEPKPTFTNRSNQKDQDQFPATSRGDMIRPNDLIDDDDGAHEDEDVDEEPVTTEVVVETAEMPEIAKALPVFTPDQHNAACVIQVHWRRAFRRKQHPVSILSTIRNQFVLQCLEEDQKIKWTSKSLYRLLFRGPLPHLLACLNVAHSSILKRKNRAKKRMRIVKHQELDHVSTELTEIATLKKKIERLQKSLAPTAKVHCERNTEELKGQVKEAHDFILSLPDNEALQDDLQIVASSILFDGNPKPKKQRPDICLDDDEYE